jgi:hypothetical protein
MRGKIIRAGRGERIGWLSTYREDRVSILVRFTPSSMTAEKYDAVSSKLKDAGHWPPDGIELHVCFGSGSALRVSEVWESTEKMEAFGAILMPILEESGIDVQTTAPEIVDIHSLQVFSTSAVA